MKSDRTTFLKDVASDWRGLTRSQKWLYFLYFLLFDTHFLAFVRAFENRVGLSFFVPYSDTFFLVVATLGCITIFVKKVKLRDIILLVSLVIFHIVSINVHSDTAMFAIENASNFYWACLPMYIVGLTIDSKSSPRLFVVIAYLVLILLIVYLYVFGMGTDDEGEEMEELMGVAYNLLPFACLLLWNAITRGGLIHWALSIVAVFLLFSLGTRGPIICLVFFLSFYLIVFKHYKYNVLVKVLIVVIGYLIYNFATEIALSFSVISSQLGLSTRVFDSIVTNEMMNIQESSGRDVIFGSVINTLTNQNILFDAHLYADRLFSDFSSHYAHNLELELLCDFGLIGGGIIILLLIWFIFRAFRSVWGSPARVLLLVLFSSSIVMLQVSGSFLVSTVFWLFIGMCTAMIRDGKKEVILQTDRIGQVQTPSSIVLNPQ